LDDAMYWSSQLLEIGYKIKVLERFELLNWAKRLDDDKVSVIAFWAKQGLSFRSSDLAKEEIAVKFEKKPKMAAFFKDSSPLNPFILATFAPYLYAKVKEVFINYLFSSPIFRRKKCKIY
jgi:hypothetical protein